MTRSRALSGVLIAVLLGADPAATQQLAVVSRADDAVVFHDAASGEEIRRVAVGSFPHEIAVEPNGRFALVASYGGDTVDRIDLVSGDVEQFSLAPHGLLHGIVAGPRGDLAWVTAEEAGVVLEIDAGTGELLRTWATRGEQSHMLAMTPGGEILYVANIRSGTVSVIDRMGGTVRTIGTGGGAEGIDMAPDGSEVWVSNRADNTISIIETTTGTVVETLDTGGEFPVKVRFRPGGEEVWVANNRSGSVAVFDRRARRLSTLIQVGIRPLGLAFSADGGRAYVTRPGADEVVEVDAATRSVERRFPTGGSPDGVVWIAEPGGQKGNGT